MGADRGPVCAAGEAAAARAGLLSAAAQQRLRRWSQRQGWRVVAGLTRQAPVRLGRQR